MSAVRQNFHTDSEAVINRQINMELFASYTYLSMVRATSFFHLLIGSIVKFHIFKYRLLKASRAQKFYEYCPRTKAN